MGKKHMQLQGFVPNKILWFLKKKRHQRCRDCVSSNLLTSICTSHVNVCYSQRLGSDHSINTEQPPEHTALISSPFRQSAKRPLKEAATSIINLICLEGFLSKMGCQHLTVCPLRIC